MVVKLGPCEKKEKIHLEYAATDVLPKLSGSTRQWTRKFLKEQNHGLWKTSVKRREQLVDHVMRNG